MPDLPGIGRPVIVASHFRSGTHLTMDLIRKQFAACRPARRPFANIHDSYLSLDRLNTEHHRPLDRRNALALLALAPRPLIKTHALPDFASLKDEHRPFLAELLAASDIIYTVRDGRRVLCSMYAWMQNFGGGLRTESGETMTFARFIRGESPKNGLSRAAEWADHVTRWFNTDGVQVVRFEDVVGNTEAALTRLEQPLLPRPITSGRETKIARLLGRLESTNIHNGAHKPMNPAEAFSDDDLAFFWREAGHAMRLLGYCQDPSAGPQAGNAPAAS